MTPFLTVLWTCIIVMIIAATVSISAPSAFASNKTLGGCHPYNCNPVPCAGYPDIMCYTAFNVNLNATVQLANPLSYPNTTIDPNGCHTDMATNIQNVLKEKQQNPAMYKSDAKDASKSSLDAALLWCGIEK